MPFRQPWPVMRLYSGGTWELLEPLTYQGKVDPFVVHPGFRTDFASVPRFFTSIIPRQGRYSMAAVLHDWACVHGIREGRLSGRDADGIFRRIMREAGVPLVMRWLIWTAVRWGAIKNPIRRKEWWKDAPKVLLITLPMLPLAVVAALPAALVYLVYLALEGIVALVTGEV